MKNTQQMDLLSKAKLQQIICSEHGNHSIVEANAQISAVSGRIIKQKVTFLGKETIKLGEESFDTLHFNFSSTDKKLDKDKKLNTDVWYDEKTLNWVKASFNKKGKWEYQLVLIEQFLNFKCFNSKIT